MDNLFLRSSSHAVVLLAVLLCWQSILSYCFEFPISRYQTLIIDSRTVSARRTTAWLLKIATYHVLLSHLGCSTDIVLLS